MPSTALISEGIVAEMLSICRGHVWDCCVLHSPKFVKRIEGEGMPKDDGSKGDLLISFNTTFPKYLTADQQAEIKRILNAKQ